MDNRNSALCTKCHIKDGWVGASHKTSSKIWDGALSNPWPKTPYLTVAENGCESCHTQHSAGGPQRLLYYLEEERNCYSCHNGHVASKNIEAQFQKMSRHPVEATTTGLTGNFHDPRAEQAVTSITGHVECADCHNPHASTGAISPPPLVPGSLSKVSGVSTAGTRVFPASYEYEVCFKCHADFNSSLPFVPRVINSANTRLEFSPSNPSYHPVVGIGRNPNVPSIPSTSEPSLTASSIIYCTACHSDDSGVSRGPHGSSYAPILRDRYETTDGTPESAAAYDLCYRCHNRTSILNDQSFRKNGHSGHLKKGATCSACHDPHGVADDGLSGSHTNLINFDTRIVFPISSVPPNNKPRFNDTGLFSGSCTLICHNKRHNNQSYP
jgi:predicted CXXCH cytochrome family protein